MNVLMNKNDDCCRLIRRVIDHQVELPHHFPESCTEINRIVWSIFDASTSKTRDTSLSSSAQCISSLVRFSPHMITDRSGKTDAPHRRILQLKQALEFMESSYNQPITLEEMVKRRYVSPNISADFFTR